jgi:GWxTD domain-containing protein
MKAGLIIANVLFLLFQPGSLFGQEVNSDLQSEEALDYYEKWLKEDAVYIISSDEREVFQNLTTLEEKEKFIEQFWFRRDPDPTTAVNEYKEEHYRRIAFANDHYESGRAGWRTDRGRIYIIHGEPAEIEAHPNVGNYERPMSEGGGSTAAFPFEIWRYNFIEGLGSDILIEFVDPTMSGEYRLAERYEDKDALMFTPGTGLTLDEQAGRAGRADRPFFKPGNREKYPYMNRTSRDNPFYRYELYTKIQGPVSVKYNDLKELVRFEVAYDSLPFETVLSYFSLNEGQVVVPISVQVENKDLMFQKEKGLGGRESPVAKLAVYGVITTMTNQIVTEFEDDLETSLSAQNPKDGVFASSIYQKVVVLDRGRRYKLDLVVKDTNSNQVGVKRMAVSPPKYTEELATSSLILSRQIQVLERIPETDEMFVLGDVKILPNLSCEFGAGETLGVYFQLYNLGIDQASLTPAVATEYNLYREGTLAARTIDSGSQSIQYFSGDRVVFVKELSLEGLDPGQYTLQVKVKDRLKNEDIDLDHQFTLLDTG